MKKPPFMNMKTLHLSRLSRIIKAEKLITLSPNLTQLCLDQIHSKTIMKRMLNQLSNRTCDLPNLSHLNLEDCKHVQGKILVVFKSEWPNLLHLSLLRTQVSETDLEYLCLACNGPEKTLPNMTSLCLTIHSTKSTDTLCLKLFALPWLNLEKLYVDFKFNSDTIGLCNAINNQKPPNLTCLRIRTATVTQQATEPQRLDKLAKLQWLYLHNFFLCSKFQIVLSTLVLSEPGISCSAYFMGILSSLIIQGFPLLTNLVLSNNRLKAQDLASLAQAKTKGNLPLLKHLDLSCNDFSQLQFECLFDGPCSWNELISLDIRGEIRPWELTNYMNEIVSRGYLASLQKLGIDHFEIEICRWNHLEKLFLVECEDEELTHIADTIMWGFLPTLRALCIKYFDEHNADIVRALSQLGVSYHETCIPFGNDFSHNKCLCET